MGECRYHDHERPVHAIPLTRVHPEHNKHRIHMRLRKKRIADPSSMMQEQVSVNTRVSSLALETLNEHHKLVRTKKGHAYDISPHGTIALTNLRDSQYVGPIGVGTASREPKSPQSFINVVFDTGSTNLWVSSVLCKDYVCRDRHKYDNKGSSTYMHPPPDTLPLDITFGTGELSGPQAIDSLSVGDYKVHNQTFAMIEHEIGSIFSQIPFEGILGLAFPSMAADGHTPFFDNVMQQDVLNGRNEFSFFFTKLPDQASAIFFGGVDKRFFQGPIRMFPVVQPHYWAIELVDFLIGDESYTTDTGFRYGNWLDNDSNLPERKVDKLIVDTGTTYFTAPPAICDKILRKIPGGNCQGTRNYPNLTYKLVDENGVPFDLVVPPSVYMVTDDGEYCEPAFMAIDVPGKYGPAFLLGEVFMRHWHTTFDRGDGSEGSAFVGFAPAKHDAEAMGELEQTRLKYL
jgi:pepsin A